jgi:hypothetical protein
MLQAPLVDERVYVHEAGHAVVNIVLCGNPGRIDVEKDGSGRCRLTWDHDRDRKLSSDDEGFVILELLGAVAGIRAEALIYGDIDIAGARDDYKDLERALVGRMPFPALHRVTKQTAEAIVDHLLKRFERPLRACADALRVGHTPADRVWDAISQADAEGALAWYREFPVLEHGQWPRRWAELRQQVGRAHAFAVVDAPVPPERDYVELRARHRRLQQQILSRR